MIICSICTGRHETHACVIARSYVAQCFESREPDDFVNEPAKIIPFPKVMHVEHQVGRATRGAHRHKHYNEGVRVERLA